MRKALCVVTFIVVSFLAAACGSDSPSTPAPPPATTQSITVTGPDRVFIGGSETYTATATMSDGTTRAVTSGWASDAPSVVAADPTGRATGVGAGMATVYVIHDGRQGQKVVRGLPNFQGVWSGSYAVRSCTQSGQMALLNACGDTFMVNRVLPTNLNLTQDGDRVQGRFFLGSLGGDTSGSVETAGRLQLTGAIQDSGLTIETVWSVESVSPGRMTGGLSLLMRGAGLTGDIRISADIRDLNRTTGFAPADSGVVGPAPHDLPSALRALTVRR